MRPGLTGWTQVNGNINWSWEVRMEMDVWYVAHWSLGLDARIIGRTVPTIVFGERQKETPTDRITDHGYRVPWPGAGEYRRDGRHFHAANGPRT